MITISDYDYDLWLRLWLRLWFMITISDYDYDYDYDLWLQFMITTIITGAVVHIHFYLTFMVTASSQFLSE